MINHTTNYSYDTISGNVEDVTDPGENTNTKKDENVRMKKKKVRVASGVLGFLCLGCLVVGRHNGHQYRTSVGTTATSSSIVSFLPLDPADRVAGCQQLCASRPLDYCYTYNFEDSEMVDYEYALLTFCVEDEQVCV